MYQKIRLLGIGSSGRATLVRKKPDDRDQLFVMKEISISMLQPVEQAQARQEAQLLSTLHHRNVVKFVESFETNRSIVIITEYESGGDLHSFISSRSALIPETTIWKW
ncbi:kinase-like domain-containing protein [Cladochytrium replicatum]|nr:kinase-like domain-containing protein [Cladochytrium replicatum]